jgi:cobalt/nickel transport system permease protein
MSNYRGYLEKNLLHFSEKLQESVFAEEAANFSGWLQKVDPRVKTAGLILQVLACSISHNIITIVLLLLFSLVLVGGSHLFQSGFLRRLWFFIPVYTAVIALPALFLTPGDSLGETMITRQGLLSAAFLVFRVVTCVSFMLLLILTTHWSVLLKALRSMGVPHLLVFMLAMTHRYIYVLLQTTHSLFLARQSRKVGIEAWRNARQWMGAISGVLLGKSYSLSSEVYLAMISRGFQGEPIVLTEFRMRPGDFAWLLLFCASAGMVIFQRFAF